MNGTWLEQEKMSDEKNHQCIVLKGNETVFSEGLKELKKQNSKYFFKICKHRLLHVMKFKAYILKCYNSIIEQCAA